MKQLIEEDQISRQRSLERQAGAEAGRGSTLATSQPVKIEVIPKNCQNSRPSGGSAHWTTPMKNDPLLENPRSAAVRSINCSQIILAFGNVIPS